MGWGERRKAQCVKTKWDKCDHEIIPNIFAEELAKVDPLAYFSSSMVLECVFCGSFDEGAIGTIEVLHKKDCLWIRANQYVGKSYLPHKIKES